MEEIGTKLLATNSMTLFGLFFPHSPVAMPQKSENRPYASTHWGSSLFIVNFIVTHYYFVLFIIMYYNLLPFIIIFHYFLLLVICAFAWPTVTPRGKFSEFYYYSIFFIIIYYYLSLFVIIYFYFVLFVMCVPYNANICREANLVKFTIIYHFSLFFIVNQYCFLIFITIFHFFIIIFVIYYYLLCAFAWPTDTPRGEFS